MGKIARIKQGGFFKKGQVIVTNIKKNGINAIDYENDTVLLYALEKNNSELVRACIK